MPNPTEFISRAEVERRVGLRKTALYRMLREGRFPRPVRLGSKTVRWVSAEVDAWMRDRLVERDRAA